MKRIYIFLQLFLSCSILYAQTWEGTVNSNWNDPANWSPAVVPGASSAVIINKMAVSYHPMLTNHVNIASLNMSAGVINLNGFTLTCSGHAILTGDSLLNGKVTALTFDNVANMRLGGKIILEKTGASNEFWGGNNKFHGDSLIVIWRWGTLHLENEASAPDSIFGHFKIQLADDYGVTFSNNSLLYVQNDLILDNIGNGTFSWNNSHNETVIGGNLAALNFSNTTTNLILKNITTLGSNANGPFKCYTGSISYCTFNGSFSLVADSSVGYDINNSSFLGADNLFQALAFTAHDNRFGQPGPGTTILRSANKTASHVYTRFGHNKFYGNGQLETYAAMPGGVTIQQNFYGEDSCWGNFSYILKGNAALVTNENGISYVASNVLIDGQGARKWVQFTGNTGNYYIGGNFTVKNFTPLSEPGVGNTNVHLRNVYVSGTDTCGTFYCYTGDITNCSFNGNFKLIGDSAAGYNIVSSSFWGADNLFQAHAFNAYNSLFGQAGSGNTILRSANNTASSIYSRFGNNKYYGNAQLETYAAVPGGVTIQQNFYGKDSCWGNFSYILKGNASLVTNENGISYVAGNVVIDGQGARKWVQFTGNTGNYYIGGNFTVKNFTPLPDAGYPPATATNVHLRNVYAEGTDTCGTFYCTTGDITNCSFNGNFKLIADSASGYDIVNSSFGGADNLFQALGFGAHDNRFGKPGTGTTLLRSTNNTAGHVYTRFGNNKYYGNGQLETYAAVPAGVTIQQNFWGADSCWGNFSYILKGNASLVTNENGISYVAGNVVIDGQGARKWVQFTGGTGNYYIGGNFTVKNFTPLPDAGYPPATATNVHLRNVYAEGTDTCGTFYCTTGDISYSRFNGNFKLIGDSSQTYNLNHSSFLGADNLFQSGSLDVQTNFFGKSGSGITILRAAHNLASLVYVRVANNNFLGDAQFDTYAKLPGGTTFQQAFDGRQDTCFGNLTVNLYGSSNIYLAATANLFLNKSLLLNNNSTTSGVIQNTGMTAVVFIGTDTADYTYSGSGVAPAIQNFVINKKGGIRLQSPLTFSGALNFTRGIILSSLTNPVNIPAGALITPAWDSSYVDGPVYKTGNSNFEFPLGKNNIYAPISITAPSLSTDVFRAQYFKIIPHDAGYDSSQHDFSLHHISRSEYWLLDRINGTATPRITLSWKSIRSGAVTNMNDLRVARWNGSMWNDLGFADYTGTNEAGTIQPHNNITNFSPFTLASTSVSNPLPVQFIFFNATLRTDRSVLLQWKTAQEINNAQFEVQRSADGRNWITLSVVQPQASNEYEYIDSRITGGITYYRIKQADMGGGYSYSVVRAIRTDNNKQLFIWPNPVSNTLFVQTPAATGKMEITDGSGRLILTLLINNTVTVIPVQQLAKGFYFIRVRQQEEVYTAKFVKE